MSNVQAFKRSNVQTSNGKVSDAHASHCKRPKVRIPSMQTSNVHNNKTYTRSQVQVFELRTCIISSVNLQTGKHANGKPHNLNSSNRKCLSAKRSNVKLHSFAHHAFTRSSPKRANIKLKVPNVQT